MPYTILRFKKLKGGAIGSCERHNERKKEIYKSNPDIDIEKSKQNYHIIDPPKYTYKRKVDDLIKKSQCKTRKDSVKLVETIITASPEFMQKLSLSEQKEYFKRATDFMIDKVGKQNIISAVVHMDESNPHMHLVFCPINKENKLSAKSILGNQKSLSQWQTDYFECMHERWNELERGKSSIETKRKHIPTWLFKLSTSLDSRYDELTKIINNANVLNVKKTKEELTKILITFLPQTKRFEKEIESLEPYIQNLKDQISDKIDTITQLRGDKRYLEDELEDEKYKNLYKLESMQDEVKKYKKILDKVPEDIIKDIEEKTKKKQRDYGAR
jgi:hypothetical protein